MDFSDSFRIVNLVVGVVMILGGISQFFYPSMYVCAPSCSSILSLSALVDMGRIHGYLCKRATSVANKNETSHSIVVGVYAIIFGACVGLLEFQIPPQVSRYASFMFSFLGRGIFYIFIGSILLSGHWARYVAGSVIGLTGVAYAALEFVPSIEPPANMREADQGWGAEEV
ncbi:Golgi apparatus membrane protein TVP15 [Nemania sp. FL0031]|nr:Golgi apparatus membrane protein TVP15 [Nemania sp. FL0031]